MLAVETPRHSKSPSIPATRHADSSVPLLANARPAGNPAGRGARLFRGAKRKRAGNGDIMRAAIIIP